jgi:O-acetyl-ADP-ribose deacetylase (regulator of RNase III)
MIIRQADITTLPVDAIVNAANSALVGGGGVDGAIHDAAGPELLEACLRLGGCETGDVTVTSAYSLPSKYVFHAVGPVWRAGKYGEQEQLRSCYRRSMELATELKLSSIAFPAISCGTFMFPVNQAADIAITTVDEMLATSPYRSSFLLSSIHVLHVYTGNLWHSDAPDDPLAC